MNRPTTYLLDVDSADTAKAPSATVTWRHENCDAIFQQTEMVDEQLGRVKRERESDPAKIERTMRRGQLLVRFAREGRLRDIEQIVSRCPPDEMLTWFAVQMFKEACEHNRLQTVRFMVSHGLDVSFYAVLEAAHWLVDGCDEARDGKDLIPAIDFLVGEAGLPPDVQRKSDFRTPLHLAVERGLFEAARRLIELGADINAVAKDDVLPLTLAEKGGEEAGVDNAINGDGFSPSSNNITANDISAPTEEMTTTTTAASTGKSSPSNSLRLPWEIEDYSRSVVEMGPGVDTHQHSDAFARRAISRERICGLLVKRGARRTWRRAPSKQQTTLDRKYAALLEDDDGRNLCTFSG